MKFKLPGKNFIEVLFMEVSLKERTSTSTHVSLTFCSILIIVLLFVSSGFNKTFAGAGINRQINFQGKLVNADSTNVSNTSRNIVFTLYDAASSGTILWSETQSVTTADGIFRVSLGSVTSIPTSVDFNSDSLYLGIKVGSDAEMTPRVRMAAVPYAFNSEKVGGLSVTNTTGTLTVPNGKTIQFADAFTTSGAFPLTLTQTGSTNVTLPTSGILVNRTGTETLTNKSIGSTGLTFSGASLDITTDTDEDLAIRPDGSGNTVLIADHDSHVFVSAVEPSEGDLLTVTTGANGVELAGVGGLLVNFTQANGGIGELNYGATINANGSGDSGDIIQGLAINVSSNGGNSDVSGIVVGLSGVGITGGTRYGLNINGISNTAATEYGLRIGTGWDRGVNMESPLYVTGGGANISGGLTVADNGLTITSGGAVITSGALAVNSNSITANGGLAINSASSSTYSTISGAITLQPAGSSTASSVQIGAGGSGSGTPDVLVLDIKNTSGDPSGTNGAMYYNSNSNKFRCFQNSAWTDCAIDPSTGLTIGSGGNTFVFSTSSGPSYSGTARPTKTIVLNPEYAGATLSTDGSSSTNGSLMSDNDGSSNAWRNYYEWSSTQSTLQDYTIIVRVTLPEDFSAWDSTALSLEYMTGTSQTSDNTVSAQISNATNTPGTPMCTISAAASTTWTTGTCADTTFSNWNSTDKTAVIRVKLASKNTASAKARAGAITLRYKAKF